MNNHRRDCVISKGFTKPGKKKKKKEIPSTFYQEERQSPERTRRYLREGWTSYAVKGIRSPQVCGGRSRPFLLRENSGFGFCLHSVDYTFNVPAEGIQPPLPSPLHAIIPLNGMQKQQTFTLKTTRVRVQKDHTAQHGAPSH